MNESERGDLQGVKHVGSHLTEEQQNPTCPDCGRPEDYPRCRTCKYWSPRTEMIGVGACSNYDVLFRILTGNSYLMTAQDFGCAFHAWATDYQATMGTIEDRQKSLEEFIANRLDNRPKQ